MGLLYTFFITLLFGHFMTENNFTDNINIVLYSQNDRGG